MPRTAHTLITTPLAALTLGAAIVTVLPAAAHASDVPPTPAPVVAAPAPVAVASPTRGIRPTAQLARTASYDGIPADALAAYQRAALVIDNASPGCHVEWTLLAAIGQVESAHGTLSKVEPATGVLGPVLNGRDGKRLVPDTDGGTVDGDPTYDRAVGPMQFLPSTWRTVGVDADGDGMRNPQDVDDSALAAAVFLCGSGQDLATPIGQAAAIATYNRTQDYADGVSQVAARYATEEQVATAVPPSYVVQDVTPAPTAAPKPPKHRKPKHKAPDSLAAPATPAPAPTLTPKEQAEQACTDLGLVDDPAVGNDAFDVCIAQHLGLPTPVG